MPLVEGRSIMEAKGPFIVARVGACTETLGRAFAAMGHLLP